MTEGERVEDWCRWYRASPKEYELNALLAVLENDGVTMLSKVIKRLGLELTLDFVKAAARDTTRIVESRPSS